jgi:hypothetical protein
MRASACERSIAAVADNSCPEGEHAAAAAANSGFEQRQPGSSEALELEGAWSWPGTGAAGVILEAEEPEREEYAGDMEVN